jgi:fatty acid desaturase
MQASQPAAQLPAHLTRIQALRAAFALASDWAIIAACFSLAIALPHPAVLVTAAILMARTQLALAVLMHESAHRLLARPRWLNDFIGQVFTAAPLMLSLFSYRHGHLQHHRAPMAGTDPVAVIFGIGDYPVSRRELAWRLFNDLTSIAYFMSLRDFASGKYRHLARTRRPAPMTKVFVLGSILIMNGAMIAALWAAGAVHLYLLLWILPSITVLQVFARVRAITEHAGYPAGADQLRNARSIVSPNWQTFFFGPHAIHFHIEHHAHVRAPFYRLRQVHQHMKTCGVLPQANLYQGYGQVLLDVTEPRP